ncbi:MAG TPA: YceI family protein [Acidimicrobiales bacterium]
MTDTISTRSTDASLAPDPGTYKIDSSHSMVEFVGRHLVVTKVRGRFTDFAGEIVVGESPEDSAVNVTIQAASIDSGDERRDEHLRGPDFLDVENFPTLEFHNTKTEQSARGVKVEGDLTIKGVTRPVVLDAEYDGSFGDPWGGQRIGFSATTEIDREDWGLTWNVALESGGVLVSKKVKIELTVSAVKH